jgi:hypothetical protein
MDDCSRTEHDRQPRCRLSSIVLPDIYRAGAIFIGPAFGKTQGRGHIRQVGGNFPALAQLINAENLQKTGGIPIDHHKITVRGAA